MFWLYLVIVRWLTLYRTIYCMWSAQGSLSVVTLAVAEIIAIYVLSWVSYTIVAWAMQETDQPIRTKAKDKPEQTENRNP